MAVFLKMVFLMVMIGIVLFGMGGGVDALKCHCLKDKGTACDSGSTQECGGDSKGIPACFKGFVRDGETEVLNKGCATFSAKDTNDGKDFCINTDAPKYEEHSCRCFSDMCNSSQNLLALGWTMTVLLVIFFSFIGAQ